MAADRIICNCRNVSYIDIRKAMIDGARTVEEIKAKTGAGAGCGGCIGKVSEILVSACGCTGATLKDVTEAVINGADTVELVGEATKAGTCCGSCRPLIQNVIELKK